MAEDFLLTTSLRFDWSMIAVRDCHPWDFGWNSENPSPLYMLDYHRDRMLKAATYWGWAKAIKALEGQQGLDMLDHCVRNTLEQRLGERGARDGGPMRIRLLLANDGALAVENYPVPAAALANLFPDQLPAPEGSENPRSPRGEEQRLGSLSLTPPYDVYIDTGLTSTSEFTHFKTTNRTMYDRARQRVGLKPTDVTKEVLIVSEATGFIMEGSLTTPYFWRDGGWVTPHVSSSFDAQDSTGGQDGTTRRWALKRALATEGDVKAADLVDGEAVWLSNGARGFVFGRIRRIPEP